MGKVPTAVYWWASVTTHDAGRFTARVTEHVERSDDREEPSPHVTDTTASREAPVATTVDVVSWSSRGDGRPATAATGIGTRRVDSAADAAGMPESRTAQAATAASARRPILFTRPLYVGAATPASRA